MFTCTVSIRAGKEVKDRVSVVNLRTSDQVTKKEVF